MFKKLVNAVVGSPTSRLTKKLRPQVDEVTAFEPELQQLSNDELKAQTLILKERLSNGESTDDILTRAYALVREASRRTTGLRHYDVQIMGGILLHQGQVVEMRTGEGKTLVATLPLYLNALEGRGIHLVTVNDYLARRDGGWMGKIFHALGLTVGCIGPQNYSALFDPEYVNPGAELEDERLVHWRPVMRVQAYRADITYGISSEFGFDYLRDNMAMNPDDLVQRELYMAVIDEVDNILIDEARTPLIISGPADQSSRLYNDFAEYVRNLKKNTADENEEPNGDYDIDEKSRSISLTERGIAKIEERVPDVDVSAGESLYDPKHYKLTYYLDNAMKAQYLFHRDKDYMVDPSGQVIIIDDFTGRPMPGRRYSEGLHEAIEAKEKVQVKRETVTVATITLQNYFRMYERLAGMTGTALTDAEEFDKIYSLGVTALPTNVEYIVETGLMGLQERKEKVENANQIYFVKPEAPDTPAFYKRTDFPDQVYRSLDAKDQAIVAEIKRVHETGRPVLVGTTSVEHSEIIHKLLERARVPHAVLNAKIHQSEALLVAQAGRKGAVTISTNMAGRGTDILLGGNPEGLSAQALDDVLFDRTLLTKLALTLLTEGEDSARSLTQKSSKLQPELIAVIKETKVAFDNALREIEEVQLEGYVIRQLQAKYGADFSEARQVVRLVAVRQLAAARQFLVEQEKDVAMVEEAVRLRSLYGQYQLIHEDPQKSAQFLAEQVFELHYNGRAALIRALLENDVAEAERVVSRAPGLNKSHIQLIQDIKAQTERERDEVKTLGGLHVVGSERHEARRIDNQLRGRAARQGDPGSSRFFLSVDDDLMRRFGGERLRSLMNGTLARFMDLPDDMPIEHSALDRLIASSQERIEGYNFDIRKNVVEYDDVMDKQRKAIYEERRQVLMGEGVDLDAKFDVAFETALEELAANYLDNYPAYVREQVVQAIQDFTTEATDTVNLSGIIRRLAPLIPGILRLDRAELERLYGDKLIERLAKLAHENIEKGTNLLQLLIAMGRFLPILPAVPNLGLLIAGSRSGYLQVRENVRRQFLEQIETFANEFLTAHLDATRKEQLVSQAVHDLNEAFNQFAVEGMSREAIKNQQTPFKEQVDRALQTLLTESLATFSSEQLVAALQGYVHKWQAQWRGRIGDEEYRNFQRLLMVRAIDREWRDYLTAMDDLRREVGLQAIAQRDPKVEYKRRSYEMFADMRSNIDEAIVNQFFRELPRHEAYVAQQRMVMAQQMKMAQAGYQVVQREHGRGAELRRDAPKVGRNDPCPCGSGKKYKHCHMKKDEQAARGVGAAAPVRNRR